MRDERLDRWFRRFQRRGDVEALGKLFDAAAPELLGVARHLLRSDADAEDAVQATFVVAIEKAAAFDEERHVMPWLFGILVRTARAARRRGGRELQVEVVGTGGEPPAPTSFDASSPAREAELKDAVEAAVSALPETYRAVVRRHFERGARPAEVARELGISANAARVRLFRGIQLLRKALPAGFAAGGAAVLSPSARAAMAAHLRPVILQRAQDAAPGLAASGAATATSGAAVGSGWLGGLLLSQRVVLVLAAGAVLLVGWFARELVRPTEAPQRPLAPGAIEVAALDAEGAARPALAAGAVSERRETGLAHAGTWRLAGGVVDAHTGAPIVGARVSTTDAEGERDERARTSDSGEFSFEATPAEEATLSITADGYAPLVLPERPDRLRTFQQEARRSGSTSGAAGARYGELRLWPGLLATGVVVHADGAPAAGAELALFWRNGYDQIEVVENHPLGATDAHGAFALTLPVPAPGEADSRPLVVALHADGIGWTRVPRLPDRRRVDGLRLVLDAGVNVAVEVRDAAGEPVPWADVAFVPGIAPFSMPEQFSYGSLWPTPRVFEERFRVSVGRDGRGELRGLLRSLEGPAPMAHYLVRVRAEGFREHSEEVVFEAGSPQSLSFVLHARGEQVVGRVVDENGEPLPSAEVVEVLGERRFAVDGSGRFRFAPETVVTSRNAAFFRATAEGYAPSGREWSSAEGEEMAPLVLYPAVSTAGRLVDQDGLGVAGIELTLMRRHERGSSSVSTVTDAAGGFRFADTSLGRWTVAVQLDPRAWELRDRFLEGGARAAELRLQRLAPPTGALVLALVDAATLLPADAVEVLIFNEQGLTNGAFDVRRAPGRLEVRDLTPARYDVWVSLADGRVGHGEYDVRDGVHEDVLRVGETGALRGRLEPAVPGATTIYARRLGGYPPAWAHGAAMRWQACGPDGRFELEGLAPGAWSLVVTGEGYLSDPLEVQVVADEAREVVVPMLAAAEVELHTVGAPAETIARVLVRDGEAWSLVFVQQRPDSAPERFTHRAGDHEWRVEFWHAREQRLAGTWEGSLSLAVGALARLTATFPADGR